ncbi:MAG TPA: DUF3105 domain-containing protein [Dehalococcoidia bacterium]|nr:DUF3105 domain-containing protein [Dehalococcoidia bacterium]
MSQDRNRRRQRQRRRREREAAETEASEEQQPQKRRRVQTGGGRAGIRETIDSFGGFLTIGGVTGALALLVYLVIANPLSSASSDPLAGDSVELPAGSEATRHTTNAGDLVGEPGEPPSGGPHFGGPECVPPDYGTFCGPLPYGVYDHQVLDGNAIHSLEHGIIWISYDPELIAGESLQSLEDLANDFSRDVILSPREQNALPIYAVSWGRILRIDGTDGVEIDELRDFITTNRNRSPEPGIRGAGHQ